MRRTKKTAKRKRIVELNSSSDDLETVLSNENSNCDYNRIDGIQNKTGPVIYDNESQSNEYVTNSKLSETLKMNYDNNSILSTLFSDDDDFVEENFRRNNNDSKTNNNHRKRRGMLSIGHQRKSESAHNKCHKSPKFTSKRKFR